MIVYLNHRNKIKQTLTFILLKWQPNTLHRVYTHQMFVDDAHDPLSKACLLNRPEETLHLFICTKMKNVAFFFKILGPHDG